MSGLMRVCWVMSEAVSSLSCEWLLANLWPPHTHPLIPPCPPFTYLPIHLLKHMYTHILIYAWTRLSLPLCHTHTRTLAAAGCQDTSERQRCHCVVLYYTWNSEPHAFLIEVICTGPCVCRSILCQWDCLSPYLYSPLTLQLLFWGHKAQTLV